MLETATSMRVRSAERALALAVMAELSVDIPLSSSLAHGQAFSL
jgi:hypothetical protein